MATRKPSPPPISVSYTRRVETVFSGDQKVETAVTQSYIQIDVSPGGDYADAFVELDLETAKAHRAALDAAIKMAEETEKNLAQSAA